MSVEIEKAKEMLLVTMTGLIGQLDNPQPADLMRIQIATSQVQATALLSIATSLEILTGPYSEVNGIIASLNSLRESWDRKSR